MDLTTALLTIDDLKQDHPYKSSRIMHGISRIFRNWNAELDRVNEPWLVIESDLGNDYARFQDGLHYLLRYIPLGLVSNPMQIVIAKSFPRGYHTLLQAAYPASGGYPPIRNINREAVQAAYARAPELRTSFACILLHHRDQANRTVSNSS